MHELNFKKHGTDNLIDQTFDQKRTLIFYVPKITSWRRITQIFVSSLFCTNLASRRWSDLASAMDMLNGWSLQSWVLHSPLCTLVFLGKCGTDLRLLMKGRCPQIVRRDNYEVQDSSCTLRHNAQAYYNKNKTWVYVYLSPRFHDPRSLGWTPSYE